VAVALAGPYAFKLLVWCQEGSLVCKNTAVQLSSSFLGVTRAICSLSSVVCLLLVEILQVQMYGSDTNCKSLLRTLSAWYEFDLQVVVMLKWRVQKMHRFRLMGNTTETEVDNWLTLHLEHCH